MIEHESLGARGRERERERDTQIARYSWMDSLTGLVDNFKLEGRTVDRER